MSRTHYALVTAGVLTAAGCTGGVIRTEGTGHSLPALSEVADAQWAALARRQVFFGHQSVGKNILTGVESLLADNPQIRLTVHEAGAADSSRSPALRHARIGRNGFPLEKLEDFTRMSTGFADSGAVAMMKFCYLDVEPATDAAALFAEYQRRMAVVRERNPGLTVLHFTMPLTLVENWKARLKAALLRRPTERQRNAVRNRYNELLRQAYEGREPVFDVARLESTLPDGGRTFFRNGADTVYVLAREYTYDGGHLTPQAGRMVAEQLLITLARLPEPSAVAGRASRD